MRSKRKTRRKTRRIRGGSFESQKDKKKVASLLKQLSVKKDVEIKKCKDKIEKDKKILHGYQQELRKCRGKIKDFEKSKNSYDQGLRKCKKEIKECHKEIKELKKPKKPLTKVDRWLAKHAAIGAEGVATAKAAALPAMNSSYSGNPMAPWATGTGAGWSPGVNLYRDKSLR